MIDNGNITDLTKDYIEGFKCYKCGQNNVFTEDDVETIKTNEIYDLGKPINK